MVMVIMTIAGGTDAAPDQRSHRLWGLTVIRSGSDAGKTEFFILAAEFQPLPLLPRGWFALIFLAPFLYYRAIHDAVGRNPAGTPDLLSGVICHTSSNFWRYTIGRPSVTVRESKLPISSLRTFHD